MVKLFLVREDNSLPKMQAHGDITARPCQECSYLLHRHGMGLVYLQILEVCAELDDMMQTPRGGGKVKCFS